MLLALCLEAATLREAIVFLCEVLTARDRLCQI